MSYGVNGSNSRKKENKKIFNKFSDQSTVSKFSLTLSPTLKIMSIEFCTYNFCTDKLFKIVINLLLC